MPIPNLNVTGLEGNLVQRGGLSYNSIDDLIEAHGNRFARMRREVWASDAATRLGAIEQGLTSLVLGTPLRMPMPSDSILRPIPVTAATFKYARYDDSHLQWRDTLREMRAKIPRVSSGGTLSDSFVRFRALAAEADQLEGMISNAGGALLRNAAQPLQLPRFLVMLDQEVEKADLLLDTASYLAANDRTLPGVDQWDSGTAGKVRASILSLANDIARGTGMPRNLIDVVMSDSSWEAAQEDTSLTFLGGMTNIGQTSFVEADLARHLRVNSVAVFNDPLIDYGDGLGNRPMYGDVCFVFVTPLAPGVVPGVDTTYGHETWACDFRWTSGVVGRPWFDNSTNSDVWPFHAANRPLVTSVAAGGILRDTSAAV